MDWPKIFTLVTGIAICETLALTFIYKYGQSFWLPHFLLGVFFYALVAWLLVQAFRLGNVALIFALYSSLVLSFILVVGHFYYHEKWHIKASITLVFVIGAVLYLYFYNRNKRKTGNWIS